MIFAYVACFAYFSFMFFFMNLLMCFTFLLSQKGLATSCSHVFLFFYDMRFLSCFFVLLFLNVSFFLFSVASSVHVV